MVKTNAENIDKKDKESLKALSDKIPPPQIKYQLNIILFFEFVVNFKVTILSYFVFFCCSML